MYIEIFLILTSLSYQLYYCKVLLLSPQYPTQQNILNIKDNCNYGVFTYYTPLNQLINIAKTLDSPQQFQSHLFSAYFKDHTIIAYQSINAELYEIYHVIKIQLTLDTFQEYKFQQDYLQYEGQEVGTIFSYSQQQQLLKLKVYTKYKMDTIEIDNIILSQQNVQFRFGGINKDLNLKGFQGILFQVLCETYFEKIEYLYSIYCYESRKDYSIESMQYVSTKVNNLNMPVVIYQEFQMQLWNKFETKIFSQSLIQFLVIDTQKEINPNYSLGRYTFQLYYQFQSDQELIIYCKYYSFEFPYNYYNEDYIKSLIKEKQIINIDPRDINNWHYIKIQYQNEILLIQIYFPDLNQNIIVEIQQVRQFSQTASQIIINAKSDQDLQIQGQIASLIFNACMSDFSNFKPCHLSCTTCFGPFYNNCLSCEENSNRVYNEVESTCTCRLWTLEKNNNQCYNLLEDSFVQIEYEQTSDIQGYDQIEPEIICAFGYFLYDGECIRCPSQSQNGYIICIECLMNWKTWIFNTTCINYEIINSKWKDIYMYSKVDLIDLMQNRLYTYGDDELRVCNYCFTFCDPIQTSLNCHKLNVNHLGQQAYVYCFFEYDEINQVCLPKQTIENYNENTCGFKCLKCNSYNKICLQCVNKNDILQLNKQDCQQCTIPYCKYCFQYLPDDEIIISTLINQVNQNFQFEQESEILNEDYLIGCALCEQNYIFNFLSMKCEPKQSNNNLCTDYYINEQGNQICLTTLTKDFNQGYEISDCTDFIEKCIKCIQSNRKKLFCTQCSNGYYINNQGLCNQCNQQFTECLPDYIIANNTFITQVQPFLQAISKNYQIAFSNFQYQDIYGICKGSQLYSRLCFIEFQIPYCLQYSTDSCLECQSSQYLEKITLYEGRCFKCPYQCLYCQPQTLTEQLYCLQTNFEQLSIDQLTGRPIPKAQNNVKYIQNLIYSFDNYIQFYEIESNLTFSTITINIDVYIQYFNNFLVDIPYGNPIYSELYISKLIINSKLEELMVCPFGFKIYDFNEIIIKDFQISLNEQFCGNILNIRSVNGTKLTFQNITITLEQQINLHKILFTLDDINFLEFHSVTFDFIQIQNIPMFYIKQNKTQNGLSMRLENVIFKNCFLLNTSIIQVDLTDPNNVENFMYFNNLTFINCTFKFSHLILIAGEQNKLFLSYISFSEVSIMNSMIEGFSFIKNYQANSQIIQGIKIQQCNLTKTNLFLIHSSAQFQNIEIAETKFFNSSLLSSQSNSRLFQYSLKLEISQLYLIDIFSNSNLIKIYHDYYMDIKIQTILIDILNQTVDQNQIYFLISIQAKNILIQDYFCSKIISSSFQINIINSMYIKVQNVQIYGLQSINLISHERQLDFNFEPTLQNLIHIQSSKFITFIGFNITNLKIQNSNFIKLSDDSNVLEVLVSGFQIKNIILIQEFGIYETSLIQFQNSKASKVVFDNFQFSYIFGNSYEKIRKTSIQLSLISFLSFQSEIMLTNFKFDNTLITYTSNALVYIESKQILIQNLTSTFANIHTDWLYQYINTIYSNLSIKVLEQLFPIQSEGSVFNIQSQYLTFINMSSMFSKALQGGFCKIELVLESEFIINNLSIIESIAIGEKESKGGAFYVNAKDSSLLMKFINIQIKNSYSLYDGGFLYLIPSNIYNRLEFRNITAQNVISLFRGFFSIEFSLQSQYNFVILSKIQANVYFDAFLNNTNQYQELNENELSYIRENNGYFYLAYCNLTINDIFLSFDVINQPVFSLTKIENMKILNINLQVGELLTNSLILFESYKNSRLKYLHINQLTLQQNQFRLSSFYKEPCFQIQKQEILLLENSQAISFFLKQKNCLITQIILRSLPPDQLISIKFFDDQQKFLIQDLTIVQFSHITFQLGLFNIHYQKYFKSRLEQLNFINNSCSSNNKLNISSQQLGQEEQIILKRHVFYNNSNSKDGQVSISNVKFKIQQSLYIHNTALQKGGAIYLQNSPFYIKNSVISENEANQGGGIFNNKIFKNDRVKSLSTTLFFNNRALYKTNNYGQEYYQLKIYTNVQINYIINNSFENKYSTQNGIILLHLPSGQQLQSYREFDMKSLTFSNNSFILKLRIQNYFQEDQTLNDLQTLCNIEQDLLNEDFTILQNNFSYTQKQFNTDENALNLEDTSFILNPYTNNQLLVRISCDAIEDANYKFNFYVKTIKCQMGEYFLDDQCLACNASKGYYSINPLIGQCEKSNPYYIRNHTENLLDLYPGVWRYNLYSSILEQCSNQPKNCLGGWKIGDETCLKGTIGALCQECDLYNTRGLGKYSKTAEYTCLLCGNQGIILLEFFFVFIWVLIQITLTVKSTQLQNQNFLYCKAQTKMYDILVRLSQDQSGTVIKLISNYFQIILVVYTFQLNFISDIEDLFKFVGNATYSNTNNFDCYLSNMDIDYIYLNLAFIILVQIIQYILFISLSFLLYQLQLNKFSQETIYSSFFYLYLSGFLNLIKILSSLLTPKMYGNQEWISANVAHKYWTPVHLRAVYFFIIPLMICFGLIFPIILFITLNQNKKNFNNYSIKQKFGYLFNEYQKNYYYWELIRLSQRLLLTLIIVLLQDFIFTKGILLICLLFTYYLIFTNSKPYNVGKLNKFEIDCLILCTISLLLCLIQFSIQDKSIIINYIIQILILISLLYLVYQSIIKFISVHISKYEGLLDTIKLVIKKYIKIEFVQKSKYLELNVERRSRIKRLFRILKDRINKRQKQPAVLTNIFSDHRYTQISLEGKDEQSQKQRLF
ncbi:unnamed protein product [Paramecium sonneborni]|uniref:Transmembrane protein n=1 Tax=Paramecium sonneborni TaxID=65129 RepID=A0A8S1LJ01_9CILI|nr:unnamed protein product [Paramecium sonneborni]